MILRAGYDVVDAQVHLYDEKDFGVNHFNINRIHEGVKAYICRIDSYGPSRFLVSDERVEEKKGCWVSIAADMPHEVTVGDIPQILLVVWVK